MSAVCPRCHSVSSDGTARCTQCGADLASGAGATLANPPPSGIQRGAIGTGAVLHDKYRLLEQLGRGGMGVVYKAQDLRLKRTVALKFLSPELMHEPDARQRFLHEARAASELDHPNICTIHDVGEVDSGQLYIAMTHYEGESLRDRIGRGPFALDEAVGIALQLARGLDMAHRKGIVHRDVKPANVLLTRDGVAKIVDFGLAIASGTTRLTQTGATVGTAAYMSPEQARGEPTDQRTDLWSLGAILYEMLTGRRPFEREQHASVLYAVVHENPAPPRTLRPGIPARLEHVVLRALEKARDARYGSAAQIIEDLRAWQSVSETESVPRALAVLLAQARTPRVAISALAVLLVAGGLGAWYFDRQAKVRWARDVAIPEVERLVAENDAWRNLEPAYDLAVRVEAIVPDDPRLARVFAQASLTPSIRTEPPGARVYMKPYRAPEDEWKYLGDTPLEKIRLPVGVFRWKLEKDGYETVLAAASTWNIEFGEELRFVPFDFVRALDLRGAAPPGMVRVSATETDAGKIGEFFIDRHEVTNRQFKAFVEAGGYRDRKFWTHCFMRGGKELAWEQALREFVDSSGRPGPSTWQAGDYAEGQADFPVSGVSWYEAAAYAEFAGKTLPTAQHWDIARGGLTPVFQFPQLGGDALFVPYSNFNGKGPVAVESLPGITAYGAYDMAGNVREWCWNETPKGRCVRGGAWDDNTYMFGAGSQAPPMDRSARNGFRCALYPDPGQVPPAATAAIAFHEPRNLYAEKPVPDSVYQAYKEQFSYDRTALNARVEARMESENWIREKVSFDAAYGGERVTGHLFLPRNAKPPYQVVVYFPGSASLLQRSSADIESYYEFPMYLSFIVKSGRAALYPAYKGTFERGNGAAALFVDGQPTRAYSEFLVQVIKDFRRSLDYLETRPDIDGGRIAYYGMSWGAGLGAIIPAVEERVKASILIGAGINESTRPEAALINYVGRVRTPTLILNGRYDTLLPLESSARPMFELLGTPAEHKQMKLYETDHIPPRNEYIKETLAWLDRYLGPVR